MAAGLMDTALPAGEVAQIQEAIHAIAGPEAGYHGLRTRKSGSRRFIELHLLVPGEMTVQAGHDLSEAIEDEIERRLPNMLVTTHLEPKEDGASWDGELAGGIANPAGQGSAGTMPAAPS